MYSPKVDWKDKAQVTAYAKAMGGSQFVVYKNPARDNYNITHASRTDLYRPEWVVKE